MTRIEERNLYHESLAQASNVAKVYEAYERHRHIYLIMEYCRGGDLWTVVDQQWHETQIAQLVRKILSAVAYVHDHSVVHQT